MSADTGKMYKESGVEQEISTISIDLFQLWEFDHFGISESYSWFLNT